MALVTVSVAAVGLAASTLLITASSRIDDAEVEPESIVCLNIAHGYQRVLPAESRCVPRTEVEINPNP